MATLIALTALPILARVPAAAQPQAGPEGMRRPPVAREIPPWAKGTDPVRFRQARRACWSMYQMAHTGTRKHQRVMLMEQCIKARLAQGGR